MSTGSSLLNLFQPEWWVASQLRRQAESTHLWNAVHPVHSLHNNGSAASLFCIQAQEPGLTLSQSASHVLFTAKLQTPAARATSNTCASLPASRSSCMSRDDHAHCMMRTA